MPPRPYIPKQRPQREMSLREIKARDKRQCSVDDDEAEKKDEAAAGWFTPAPRPIDVVPAERRVTLRYIARRERKKSASSLLVFKRPSDEHRVDAERLQRERGGGRRLSVYFRS